MESDIAKFIDKNANEEVLYFAIALVIGCVVINIDIVDVTLILDDLGFKDIYHKPLLIGLIMIFYALLTRFRKIHTKPAVLDSYYYLGFLFTLVTMVSVFAEYDSTNFDSEKISYLISQNGIALVSTIIGMTIRIAVRMMIFKDVSYKNKQSFKYPTESEIEAYIKLTNSMRSMGETIESVVNLQNNSSASSEALKYLNENIKALKGNIEEANLTIKTNTDLSTNNQDINNQTSEQFKENIEAARNILANSETNLLNETTKLFETINQKVKETDEQTAQLKLTHDMLMALYSDLNENISKKIGR